MPANYATALAAMDVNISYSKEARTNHAVEAVTGRTPKRFKDFVEENKKVWTIS
jgi:hypothetical protein